MSWYSLVSYYRMRCLRKYPKECLHMLPLLGFQKVCVERIKSLFQDRLSYAKYVRALQEPIPSHTDIHPHECLFYQKWILSGKHFICNSCYIQCIKGHILCWSPTLDINRPNHNGVTHAQSHTTKMKLKEAENSWNKPAFPGKGKSYQPHRKDPVNLSSLCLTLTRNNLVLTNLHLKFSWLPAPTFQKASHYVQLSTYV
jgi:hypothetical protein